MLTYVILFLIAYAAGTASVIFFMKWKSRTKLNEAIARTAIVSSQVQSFTRKIGVNTGAAIGKFSEMLLSINKSIKGTTSVVDSIRSKMSSYVNQSCETVTETSMTVIQQRYKMMLQEVMEQLNLTVQRKKEDVSKLDHIRENAARMKPFSTEIATIAFATKVISLNASIEAARAGEQGRTFGVVAAEVRNLAGKSTALAEEMEKSLNGIVQYIDHSIAELKDAIDVESRFINSTVILLQDVVMSVVESFVSISEAIDKTLGDSSTFRDEVNGIVFNLQFEDICNQMSQHTVHILDTIREDLESLKLGKDPNEENEEGKNGILSTREKIFNTARNLFTMEEERQLAREALGGGGITPPSALKIEVEPEETADSKDEDVLFFEDNPPENQESHQADRLENKDKKNEFDDTDEVIFFDDNPSPELLPAKDFHKESVRISSIEYVTPNKGKNGDGKTKDATKAPSVNVKFNDDEDVTFF